MKKLFSLTAILVFSALLAAGCCNDGGGVTPEPPDPPDPPEPPTIQQRYVTLWGESGSAGITVTETKYQGISAEYTSVTREQVANFYADMSNEVLFPLDAEYFYCTISDTDHTLYVTKWADGTTSYSLVPFGSHDTYDKVNNITTKETEAITGFATDPESTRFIQQMYHESPDLNRSNYEENPTGENGEFKIKANANSGQYL
ncbi:MAG: hypothetical protein LBL39_07580 [Planctomycetaceae bacterium]|jgi:hypothetical protein|nr:hypothetical protein [Planctomycetaceae bacterium]